MPKTEKEAEKLGPAHKKAFLARKYIDEITQYFTQRQPDFVMPKTNLYAHLPAEKKKDYPRRAQNMMRVDD